MNQQNGMYRARKNEPKIGEVILHGAGRKFAIMAKCASQWNKTKSDVRNGNERRKENREKKKSITEPCVLPKFIQFTRIDCNDDGDDDSHLECVWLGQAQISLHRDRRHAFEHGIIRNVLSFGRLIKTQAHHVQKCIDCCPNRQKHPSFAS